MGSYKSLIVFMDSIGFLRVLLGPNEFLCVLMRSYRSLLVRIGPYLSQWILVCPNESL